ncbi:protein ILRUN-like [Saccoglossus kowalevskii]|uniref:Uncharacterized protein C6orf106 homolog n=1 Tax=Saccoglossus kowalevskii TaxID=10224 RepID=A0ABM0MZI6_SACKO|nr:PREDICTED: uncharacterized protein C6orf106 homolog [Saccoglossus kowalevskii]
MEVDSELDQDLLQQFSSMGTTDKEVLISEFQKLLGNQLNPAGCAFFLDMNNWNLQAAVCSYYDFESPQCKLPTMSLVQDITIGEGESVPPNTAFVKTWRIRNSGDETWPGGVLLKFTQGHQLGASDTVPVQSLFPGQITDVSVEMISPPSCGFFQGQWRMVSRTGQYFGEVIWVILEVKEGGMLGLTQQLSSLATQDSSSIPLHHIPPHSSNHITSNLGNNDSIVAVSTGDNEDQTNIPNSPIRAPIFQISNSNTSSLLRQHQIQFGSPESQQPHQESRDFLS